MNVLRKNRRSRSLINAAGLGLALSVALSLLLVFAGAISGLPGAEKTGDSTGTSVIVSTATAAVPVTELLAAPAPLVVGSLLDEFRLDPAGCCISHY